ncbi:MAG: S16 family serine protease [Actinomycetia bacterium]|nr:S16 family serine protease [Actinomycetes bacterium]
MRPRRFADQGHTDPRAQGSQRYRDRSPYGYPALDDDQAPDNQALPRSQGVQPRTRRGRRRDQRRRGWGASAVLLAALAGMVVSLVLAQITLPYAIMTPGPIMDTLGEVGAGGEPLIAVEGAETYPTEGRLNFTTVRVGGGPGNETNVWDYLSARLSRNASILPVDEVFPRGATRTQIREENQAEMVGSQQEAAAVALRELGFAVAETVTIAGASQGSSFADSLEEGDVVIAMNGVRTDGADAIRAEVAKTAIGDDVTVTVLRDGAEVVVEGATIGAEGRPVLGVFLAREFDSDVDVTITAGDVGGPSAGMMFALGIYDVLTDGALTGGKDIAGTGTINADGQVGPIGGIVQKVFGANDGGSDYFLAPAANCAELQGRIPTGIEVFSIATFDDALAAVEGIAADNIATLPRCG